MRKQQLLSLVHSCKVKSHIKGGDCSARAVVGGPGVRGNGPTTMLVDQGWCDAQFK